MKKLFLMGLLMALLIPTTAYAKTDIYGNEIDWDTSVNVGGEDSAGNEGTIDYTVPEQTYSFDEQVKVNEEIKNNETKAPDKTGYVTINLISPDEWSESNVRVEFYRGNKKEEVILYRQNGFKASAQIPIGKYTFFKAVTLDGGYEFYSNINTFEVTETNNTVLSLSIDEKTISVTVSDDLEMYSQEDVKQAQDEIQKEGIKGTIAAFLGVFILMIGIVFIALKIKDKKNKDKFNNDLI